MGFRISLADLRRLGLCLTAGEAIAVVQRLVRDPNPAPPVPPFGAPSLANVQLTEAGIVECRACETPTVLELAILLQAMLAPTAHVPGGLRYAVARALHEVDALPVDSVADFSATLARYEPADRDAVIRRLVERARATAGANGAGPLIERRRSVRASEDLRRQLRDADRRLYESRLATVPDQAPRRRSLWVGGAVLGVVVAVAAAGDSLRGRVSTLPLVPPPPRAVDTFAPPAFEPAAIEPVITLEPVAIEPVIPLAPSPPHRPRAKHPVRALHPIASRHTHVVPFGWLRRAIVIRDDFGRR